MTRLRLPIALPVCWALAGAANAPAALAAAAAARAGGDIPVDPNLRAGTLPNGLRYYVRKNGIADSRYLVNMLTAYFGDAATKENGYGYEWLPKRNATKDYGTLTLAVGGGLVAVGAVAAGWFLRRRSRPYRL